MGITDLFGLGDFSDYGWMVWELVLYFQKAIDVRECKRGITDFAD